MFDDDDDFGLDDPALAGVGGENGREYLGTYPSLDDFFRAQLEHLVYAEGLWLLDCIDLDKVREKLEGTLYRYVWDEEGRVFRERVPPP